MIKIAKDEASRAERLKNMLTGQAILQKSAAVPGLKSLRCHQHRTQKIFFANSWHQNPKWSIFSFPWPLPRHFWGALWCQRWKVPFSTGNWMCTQLPINIWQPTKNCARDVDICCKPNTKHCLTRHRLSALCDAEWSSAQGAVVEKNTFRPMRVGR